MENFRQLLRKLKRKVLRISKTTLFLLSILAFFVIGLYFYYFRPVFNGCTMTYMYSYPEYIPVQMNSSVNDRFPSYKLFVYGEGGHSVSLSSGKFTGYPVIFVPGNAGSFKQVRSMASIAHQMFEQGSKKTRLDFFTVDFNEEMAGVVSQLLRNQVLYLVQVIARIKELYGSRFKSCIIIGHSVGGVVARGLVLEPSFKPSCVDLLITLSAPFKRPVISVDLAMTSYYDWLNKEWTRQRSLDSKSSKISHLNHVSISGGFNDVLVRSELSQLENDNHLDFSIVSTAIPDVWLSIDHLCIVWCKQFCIKLSRLIYDVVEYGDWKPDKKMKIIKYQLQDRIRGKDFSVFVPPKIVVYPPSGNWREVDQRIFRWTSNARILEPTFFLVKLVPKTTLVLWVDGEVRGDWFSGCNITGILTNKKTDGNMPVCESGMNLSHLSKIVPGSVRSSQKSNPVKRESSLGPDSSTPTSRTRMLVKVSSDSILSQGVTHVNVALMPTTSWVSFVVERFPHGKRNRAIILPSIIQSLTMIFSYITVLSVPVSDESSYYNLSMIGQEQVWHYFVIKIVTGSCYPAAEESKTTGLAHFVVPWDREDVYTPLVPDQWPNLIIRFWKLFVSTVNMGLNVPKPSVNETRSPSLELLLDPDCSYQVKIKLHFGEMVGHLIRFYYQYVFQFMLAIFVSVLSVQLTLSQSKSQLIPRDEGDQDEDNVDGTQDFVGSRVVYFQDSMERILRKRFFWVSLFGIIPAFPFIVIYLTRHLFSKEVIETSWILQSFMSLEMDNLDNIQFVTLFSVIFLFAYALCYCVSLVCQLLVHLLSKFFILIRKKIFRRSYVPPPPTLTWSTKPFITGLCLVGITVATTSNVGIFVSLILHILQLMTLSVKSYLRFERKGLSPMTTLFHCHITICIVLFVSFAASVPVSLYWLSLGCPLFSSFIPSVKSSSEQLLLREDPHMIPALFIILSMSILWQQNSIAKKNKNLSHYVCNFLMNVVSLLSCLLTHNLQFIPYITSIVLILTSVTSVSGLELISFTDSGSQHLMDHDHQD